MGTHVPNLQPANRAWGVSDLVDVVAINAELNARVSDQAETIRYHADPPVVFKGVTDHSDLTIAITPERVCPCVAPPCIDRTRGGRYPAGHR